MCCTRKRLSRILLVVTTRSCACVDVRTKARLPSATPVVTITRTVAKCCGTLVKAGVTWKVNFSTVLTCECLHPSLSLIFRCDDCAGNKRTNTVHSKDQEMKLGNAALITSFNAEDYTAGKPVRVLRGHKLDGRSAPEFAPIVPMGYDKAYRYDGLYKVNLFSSNVACSHVVV